MFKIYFFSLRNKILLFTFIIVFCLQIISTAFQYNQAKQILLTSMTDKASVSSLKFINNLNTQLSILTTKEEKINFVNLYANLQGKIILSDTLQNTSELEQIRFFDSAGKIIIEASKQPQVVDNVEPFVKDMISNQRSSSFEEGDNFIASVPVKVDGNVVGYLVFYYSNTALLSREGELISTNIIYLIIFLFTSALVSIFFSNRITRPLIALHKGIEIIGEGNLDYKVGTKVNDEIGQLSRAFDEMTLKLKTNYSDMQSRMDDLVEARRAILNVAEDAQEEKEKNAKEKSKVEAILLSIGDGLVAVDTNKKIVVMNKMAEKLLGWKLHEAIGRVYDEVITLEDEKGTYVVPEETPIQKALDTTTTTTTTETSGFYLLSKNKIKFPVAITISPIILNDKIIGVVEVFRDISKEKEIEKLRVDFLTLVSHQLRTPLSGTKWLIETMQRGVIGETNQKEKEYLKNLYEINERMISLVADILNILTLESGVVVVKKDEVSVRNLYNDLVLIMEPAAKSKNITIRNMLQDHKEFIVKSDFLVLRTILENFISNSICYSSSGQEITFDVIDKPNAFVFCIKDNGIGIPAEEQGMIFERFYRGSNAKMVKPSGTGLGLYTSALLAKRIDAQIEFDSKEGKGTTFYLQIPKNHMI